MLVRRLLMRGVGPFEELDLQFPEGRRADRADVHLLVGPNGVGKTTVLQGLAQVWRWEKDVVFFSKFRNKQSWISVLIDGKWVALVEDGNGDKYKDIDGEKLKISSKDRYGEVGIVLNVANYSSSDNLKGTFVEYAAFAYSGLRRTNENVSVVEEYRGNPLADACVFNRPEGTRPLMQWIVNTITRQSLYTTSGNVVKAAERGLALRRLTEAMERVIGRPVRFELEIDPFSVKVSIGEDAAIPVELLADGLQSLFSWLGDLLMRLDRIPWAEPGPVTDQPFLLLLDEVEVHLHPAWQRRVLPMAERLFPNAQIIATTHSPFVLSSASDAWIHAFRLEGGRVVVDPPRPGAQGMSYPAIMQELMGVPEEFDVDSEERLAAFRSLLRRWMQGEDSCIEKIDELKKELGARSIELQDIVMAEFRQAQRSRKAA